MKQKMHCIHYLVDSLTDRLNWVLGKPDKWRSMCNAAWIIRMTIGCIVTTALALTSRPWDFWSIERAAQRCHLILMTSAHWEHASSCRASIKAFVRIIALFRRIAVVSFLASVTAELQGARETERSHHHIINKPYYIVLTFRNTEASNK